MKIKMKTRLFSLPKSDPSPTKSIKNYIDCVESNLS